VKGLVREAAARELWLDTADALMGQVVRWTITAYYDHPYEHRRRPMARARTDAPTPRSTAPRTTRRPRRCFRAPRA
jgi:hypothetical protein